MRGSQRERALWNPWLKSDGNERHLEFEKEAGCFVGDNAKIKKAMKRVLSCYPFMSHSSKNSTKIP